MLIDWFTVIAQIINFLLLVWLLKKFLYQRILNAIEARETRIATQLADAAAKEKDAAAQLEVYKAKLADFEQQQNAMLAQARAEAGRRQAELLEKARAEVDALEARWQEELDRQRTAFLTELRRRAAAEVLTLTRRTVADLTGLDAQECAIGVFLDRIRTLDETARNNLAQGDLVLRTAFEVSEENQARLQQALEDRLQAPLALRFETVQGLGLGLELRGDGWRIGWNSDSYLDALEEDLRDVLEHSPEPRVQVGTT